MPEKAKSKNKVVTVHFTTYYSSKIILLQRDTKALKILFPAAKYDFPSQKCQEKSQKENQLATVHFTT